MLHDMRKHRAYENQLITNDSQCEIDFNLLAVTMPNNNKHLLNETSDRPPLMILDISDIYY